MMMLLLFFEIMMVKIMDMFYKVGVKVLIMSNNLFIFGYVS